MKIENKQIILLYDLYFLRFDKVGKPWYELTDYLRDKLIEDGLNVSYTKDDLIVKMENGTFSVKDLMDKIKKVGENYETNQKLQGK